MKFYVYILLNYDQSRWYIGSTENLEERLRRHNQGRSRATKSYKPWSLVYKEGYKTRSEAVKREFYLKSPKGYTEYRKLKETLQGGVA